MLSHPKSEDPESHGPILLKGYTYACVFFKVLQTIMTINIHVGEVMDSRHTSTDGASLSRATPVNVI